MQCRCEQCTDEPAPTYIEKYKQECLKRHNLSVKICEMTDRQDRLAEIEKYGNRHGHEAAEKLKEVVKRQWEDRGKNE